MGDVSLAGSCVGEARVGALNKAAIDYTDSVESYAMDLLSCIVI